ncbi:restriction endonuclease subunit S, partial [uncultured Alistipes sp.]|uniref:restriction endonuclease subunit S n=1 Tax=uncultured Alistipes sp. TaxID=538949 RepID=UPI00263871CF
SNVAASGFGFGRDCNGFTDYRHFNQNPCNSILSLYLSAFHFFVVTLHKQDNDIAVAKISPCLENRKSAVFTKLPNSVGGGTTELNIFRSEIVAPLYGLYFFKSDYFISNCTNSFNGVVGQQRVATSVIKDMIFCLPPYAEQKRIVAKIEELFVTIDKIKESLEA